MRFSLLALVLAASLFAAPALFAQDKAKPEQNTLTSERLDAESKNLDSIIKELDDKIQGVIQKYKLMDNNDVKIIPYQVEYNNEKDFISIERHIFIRDGMDAKITGEKRKSIKFYVSGGTLTKIETVIYERDYNNATEQFVEVVDSAPLSGTTDGISVKQTYRKKMVFNKTLGDMKNTTAFPVKNDFKRDFYIPSMTYFYNTILSIAETYSKNSKDSDSTVTEFLKESTQY